MEYKENQSIIIGKQIDLRIMEEKDYGNVIAWRNKKHVQNSFIYRKKLTMEDHLYWVKEKINKHKVIQFIICKKNGKGIGSVYFRDIDRVNKTAEYGIFIGEEEELSKGYGSEACQLMVKYGFEQLGFQSITLRLLSENGQAKRTYEKAGFREIGRENIEIEFVDSPVEITFMEVQKP